MKLWENAADALYSYRFIKALTTPWEETDAYELGIIDKNGKRDKSVKLDNREKKEAYNIFFRLVFNIKRLLEKLPGGSSQIASYAAALFLLREHANIEERSLEKIAKATGFDTFDFLVEQCDWFTLENNQLAPGVYRLKHDKLDNERCEDVIRAKDKIRIDEDCYPVGNVFGINVYEAEHINTRMKVYITTGEITR